MKSTSYNFKVVSGDTDGISFCKQNEEPFSEEEEFELLNEFNKRMKEKIKWESEGQTQRMIVLKAKNYILFDGKKIKYKGSAIKATSKQLALKEFIKELLNAMLDGKYNFVDIYNKYVKEIMDVKDIKRWATKKTISSKVLEGARKNEAIIRDAINDSEYQKGDKPYFYYKSDGKLNLVENYNGDYDKDRLLQNLYDTATGTFETVIDPSLFVNYKLKRSKEALKQLLVS